MRALLYAMPEFASGLSSKSETRHDRDVAPMGCRGLHDGGGSEGFRLWPVQ